MRKATLLTALAAFLVLGANAHASLIDIGSSLTFMFNNAPDTYNVDTTFNSTPVLVDGGAVQIWQQQTPTTGGGEWDVFYMQTVSGSPLANNVDADWSITMDYTLSQAANFDAVVDQWLVNGVPVDPLFNFSGICCASSTNPILPGEAYYNSGFTDLLPAGEQTNWLQIYADPYSIVSEGGIDPSTANEFIFALHFDPQSPATPEPATMSLLGAGLIGLAVVGRRRRARRS